MGSEMVYCSLVGRLYHPYDTIVEINNKLRIGGQEKIVVIGGPCSVENQEDLSELAIDIKKYGGQCLRGGAYKPRTSPYSFQGLGKLGLDYLTCAKYKSGLPIISEIVSEKELYDFAEKIDVIQVGARNMYNYELLKFLGKIDKPILLKRGLSATVEEWLMSAEYILKGGNDKVILCERGIRTFETYTRNTLDLSAIPIVKNLSHLPVVVDPSHGTGRVELIESMSMAAIAAGADGIMLEVHKDPNNAVSDGEQSLTPKRFKEVVNSIRRIANVMGR